MLDRVYELRDISTSTCFAPFDGIPKKFPLDSCLFKLTKERVYNFQKIIMRTHDSSEWIDYGYLICVAPARNYQIDDIIWIDPDEFQENISDLQEYFVFLKRFNLLYQPSLHWPPKDDTIFEMSMKDTYISIFERGEAYEMLVEELETCLRPFLDGELETKISKLKSLYEVNPQRFSSVYSTKFSFHDMDDDDSVDFPWFGYLEQHLRAEMEIKITNNEVNSFVNLVNETSNGVLSTLTRHGLYFQLNFEKEIVGFLSHVRSEFDNQRRLNFLYKLRQDTGSGLNTIPVVVPQLIQETISDLDDPPP